MLNCRTNLHFVAVLRARDDLIDKAAICAWVFGNDRGWMRLQSICDRRLGAVRYLLADPEAH